MQMLKSLPIQDPVTNENFTEKTLASRARRYWMRSRYRQDVFSVLRGAKWIHWETPAVPAVYTHVQSD